MLRISLSFRKAFLDYSFVTLLEQKVNELDLVTTAEKLKAIIKLKFSATLKKLNIYLDLIDWLRDYVQSYAQIVKLLQKRKTLLLRQILKNLSKFRKRTTIKISLVSTTFEIDAFEYLREVFSRSSMLVHFVSNSQLYVNIDSFKVFDFAEMIYHIMSIKIRSILFLSQELNSAEKNYWSTELKVAELVWVLRRIRNMIESIKKSSTIVYIDHFVSVSIVKQYFLTSTNTNKLNLRLVRASQYLFAFELDVRHKSDKQNIVSNALSCLLRNRTLDDADQVDFEKILDALHFDTANKSLTNYTIYVFASVLMKMSSEFKEQLISIMNKDKKWKNIVIAVIKESLITEKVQHNHEVIKRLKSKSFVIKDELLYHQKLDIRLRWWFQKL